MEQELSGQRTRGQEGGAGREGTNERKQGEASLGLHDLVTVFHFPIEYGLVQLIFKTLKPEGLRTETIFVSTFYLQ